VRNRNDANSVETVDTEQVNIFALSLLSRGLYQWTAIKRCSYLNAIKLGLSLFVLLSNTETRIERGLFSALEVSPDKTFWF